VQTRSRKHVGYLHINSALVRAASALHNVPMAETTLNNIALLIDADNTSPQAIDPVLTVMAELG
jgi:hypothetical protein